MPLRTCARCTDLCLRTACRCVPACLRGVVVYTFVHGLLEWQTIRLHPFCPSVRPAQESDLSSQTVTLDVTAATDLSAENEERANLLAYYQRQCAQFEQDQHDSLQRFAALEVSHQEMHKLRWQNRVQREEIAELQKAVSNSNVALYEERAQVLKLQAENEHLRIQVLRFVRGTGVSRVVLTCAPRSWRTAAASSTCWR